jgi:transcriptional regulator with XRE-family HTH domain
LNPTPTSTTLGALGARLRELREQAGLTGAELAAALGPGWRQPKISKIENGRQLPTEAELIAWAKATRAEAAPLVAVRSKAAAEYGTHKERIAKAGGAVAHQQDLTALAESCTFLAEFQPALMPGRLQTAAYMREKSLRDPTIADDGIALEDLGRVIAARIRRQAILYEPGREFVHVVTEAALRLRIGAMTTATLQGQLTHLSELATLPGHTFGVLPFTVACPVEPASGFQLYDRDLVRVETIAGVLQLTDPEAVARYSRWLDQLVDVALTGPDAAALCRQLAADLPSE